MTPQEQKILESLYLDVAAPSGFSSIKKLYDVAKTILPKLTRKQVIEFLQSQDTYTLHRPVIKIFKRRKTLAPHLDAIWQADLISLIQIKQENKNYCYILSCIDIVSRYAFAEPLYKKTGDEVIRAFKKIFKQSGRRPIKIHTDLGKEFWNKKVSSFFRTQKIIHYSSHSDMKAAVVERWNRTLKMRMFKFFHHKTTLRYVDTLQSMVQAYNDAPHRSLKFHSPSSVNTINQKYFWRLQFPIKINEKPAFKVGDKVRLSRLDNVFRKGYLPTFTTEVFTVHKIKTTIPICYVIKDSNSEILKGIFYKQELSKVLSSDNG